MRRTVYQRRNALRLITLPSRRCGRTHSVAGPAWHQRPLPAAVTSHAPHPIAQTELDRVGSDATVPGRVFIHPPPRRTLTMLSTVDVACNGHSASARKQPNQVFSTTDGRRPLEPGGRAVGRTGGGGGGGRAACFSIHPSPSVL